MLPSSHEIININLAIEFNSFTFQKDLFSGHTFSHVKAGKSKHYSEILHHLKDIATGKTCFPHFSLANLKSLL